MKKSELLEKINAIPGDPEVCVMNSSLNSHFACQEGTPHGMHFDFKIGNYTNEDLFEGEDEDKYSPFISLEFDEDLLDVSVMIEDTFNVICLDQKVLDDAIAKWGESAQLEMLKEECAELIVALMKLNRTAGDQKEKEESAIDEIVDVKILIAQAEKIFGRERIIERLNFKLNRLKERIKQPGHFLIRH
jgi:NTP pyrophosphatase (non-canonical NTP hydrolase)